MCKKEYGSRILRVKSVAEKILNLFRILLKVFVSFITSCMFFLAVVYWIESSPYASLSLATVGALSYFCVLKDHSEDFWKSKFDEPLEKNLGLMAVYEIDLLVILFGIVIASHFN